MNSKPRHVLVDVRYVAADAKAADEMLGDRVPVGHAGRSADVVRAVLFFVSPEADFITGQVLEVAGGARQ